MDMHGKKERHFEVRLRHRTGYQFESQAYEDGTNHGCPYVSDEPAPVGDQVGPATPAMLGSAIGHCLSASLLEHLKYAGVQVSDCETHVVSVVAPNKAGNPRITRILVTIRPSIDVSLSTEQEQSISDYQECCTVCASIRDSIDIQVQLEWQSSSDRIAG